MQVNYYRQSNAQGYEESWNSCQFTPDTDLSQFTIKPLVTINGQPFIRQHHVTYLTGKETCRAHHFAKHLAIQLLSSESTPSSSGSKVLWIDTLHGPHVSAAIYRELAAHVNDKQRFHFLCLDILGGQRDDVYWLNRNIEALIKKLQPDLVVIDDIDHFMPHCGINIANEFCSVVRDMTNHFDTAFLFIGYNHFGNKASSTGNLGRYLFTSAHDIFSLSTQREVTTVRHINGYDLSRDPDSSEFRFTIGPDNLPREAAPALGKNKATAISDDTLCDIVTTILQPGQAITPSDFISQVNARHREIKQHDRDTALLNQAYRLNLIEPSLNGTLTTPQEGTSKQGDIKQEETSKQGQPCRDSVAAPTSLDHNNLNNSVNNSLTLAHHPSTQSSESSQSTPSIVPCPQATALQPSSN